MEETIGFKKKMEPSIPENYVSILQLQKRWLKEKECKQRENEEKAERRRKHDVEEQERSEIDLEKLEAEEHPKEVGHGVRSRKYYRKGLGQKNRRFSSQILLGKERVDGGEAISGEAEDPVSAAIVIEIGEAAVAVAEGAERLPDVKRKKKSLKKKKKKKINQAPFEGNVSECEPNAPLEKCRTDNIPVKKENSRMHKPKRENLTEKRDNPSRKKAPTDPKTAIETRFEALTIKGGEALSGEAEKPVSAAIVMENGEADEAEGDERLPDLKRKTKRLWKKKVNQAPIEGNVAGCEPNAPLEKRETDNIPVKKENSRMHKPERENLTEKRDNPSRKKAPIDPKTAIEMRFEGLTIKGGEAISGEAEKPASAAIVMENGEAEEAEGDERLPDVKRKTKSILWKKKVNQAPIEGNVDGCEPNALLEKRRTDNIPVMKENSRMHKPKRENLTEKRDNPSRKKAPTDPKTAIETRFEDLTIKGGDSISGEAEKPASAAIVMENGEAEEAEEDETLPDVKRKTKRILWKKKINQAPIEENVTGCEPNPPLEKRQTDNFPVKKENSRVHKPKRENLTEERDNPPLKKAPTDPKTAIETRFEGLTIKSGEERGNIRNRKPIAPLNRNRDGKYYQSVQHRRDLMKGAMVWVKKGEIYENGGGSGQ